MTPPKQNAHRKREMRYHQSSILYAILVIFGIAQFSTAFFLAKKSLPHVSSCHPDTAITLLQDILNISPSSVTRLQQDGILAKQQQQQQHTSKTDEVVDSDAVVNSDGCWMSRRVDAMALVVVDALRFDFALESLPISLGARLESDKNKQEGEAILDPDANVIRSLSVTEGDDVGGESSTKSEGGVHGRSQLFQFVADPPTVTMQRLKGITTGGLPTFADISGNFGGADIDEDSWVQQLYDTTLSQRGGWWSSGAQQQQQRTKTAFVGDDTWIDLFPYQFHDSHPFPSFNTRDLDTVDDGCALHLPRLLQSFGSGGTPIDAATADNSFFEVVVAHFLGVDHVGHTYGPHNEHMVQKLKQMDNELDIILSKIDEAKELCQVAFVMGDHGMTEDGNHGGGSKDETNAALFAHFSPGCGDLDSSFDITGSEVGPHSEKAFQSVNQIDLVPTISLLLGLPIPYGNLGAVIPALLPPMKDGKIDTDGNYIGAPDTAAALALNAAQVWNYLMTYSSTASKLPQDTIENLESLLNQAAAKYQEALDQESGHDSIAYREACGLFKYFLSRAIDLGKQVWTRFDTVGMSFGIGMLLVALLLGFPLNSAKKIFETDTEPHTLSSASRNVGLNKKYQMIQVATVTVFIIFHCVLLTFSNSYINAEESITMLALAVLCTLPAIYRLIAQSSPRGEEKPAIFDSTTHLLMLVAISSRVHSLLVSGHGLDTMLRLHATHDMSVFLPCLFILSIVRLRFSSKISLGKLFDVHLLMDLVAILCLAFSWWEKRDENEIRRGYLASGLSLCICVTGFVMLIYEICVDAVLTWKEQKRDASSHKRKYRNVLHTVFLILWKLLIFIVTVTGPSSVASSVLLVPQAWALCRLTAVSRKEKLQAPLIAAIWRLSIRHAFFATGHSCSFNRLQYSAAFVATDTFYYTSAGVSLFLNTFGWDILGVMLLAAISKEFNRRNIWDWFCFYQLLECVGSCISVSHMRRHLMVWAIFAPRFVFASAFSLLCMVCYLSMACASLLKMRSTSKDVSNKD